MEYLITHQIEFFLIEIYNQLAFSEEIFKIPPCWDLNLRPQAYEDNALTIIMTLQVAVKGVQVCAQQSMPSHLPAGNLDGILPI